MSITPARVMTTFWLWFGTAVFALILIGGLVVGGWQAGWWFASHNINRQNYLLKHSYSYQQATAADLQQKITDVLTETSQMAAISPASQQYADLHAQRLGEADLACADASQLDAIPASESGWVRTNCLAGTVNPSSPLEK